ncbi:unnamed protein product [Hymenolepis diminuta]|uniref:Uncharacterized protein n=1 Tax=Hymenolepis diminuta TaxID=6216 RepID=A0A564YR91_HYMDI|nr:unnamed protein product [Hymenolepis diminuta]
MRCELIYFDVIEKQFTSIPLEYSQTGSKGQIETKTSGLNRSRFLMCGFLSTQTITASEEFNPTQAVVTGKGYIIWPDSGKLNVTRAIANGV